MNLERILAENMVRFGTRNLNETILRTLLNEGAKAGDDPNGNAWFYGIDASVFRNISTAIQQYTQKYNSFALKGLGDSKLGEVAWASLVLAAMPTIGQTRELRKRYPTAEQLNKAAVAINDPSELTRISPEAIKILESLIPKVQYNNELVDVYPTPKPGYPKSFIATLGQLDNSMVSDGTGRYVISLERPGEQMSTGYSTLVNYFNAFNVGNVCQNGTAPDYTQYDVANMLDAEKHLDLAKTSVSANSLIVYTTGEKTPGKADKEIQTDVVGATEPKPKQYDISFNRDDATVPANDPEVDRAVQDAIAMFPDGNFTNLTIISSASPEYNSAKGGPRTLADYGQTPTTGEGDPGAGTTDIAKNIKLAYDRGVNFVNAINAGLEAQGRPHWAIQNPTIQWQISDRGGQKVPGRYAEVRWEKAGSKGTKVSSATNTGTPGSKVDLKATYNIRKHTFSWQ